jgi:hypothetical protein
MHNIKCPICGSETAPDAACASCGQTASNGTPSGHKPAPPPELANRKFTPTPPALLEQLRHEFDEAEYLAAVREMETNGGLRLEDFIDEIDRICHGKE